jgi:hypothetical protein
MALLTTLEARQKDRQTVHRPTRCAYSVFDFEGKCYLQLDTFGSDDRQFTEKVSQSIQFDRNVASELLCLIKQTFPDLG